MNATVLINKNNERRKALSSHNLGYYENLMQYIRVSNKEEYATEEVLLEMLEHLIEAQQEGKQAEEVFGKSPKQLADEIVDTLPKEKTKTKMLLIVEVILQMAGIYILVLGALNLFNEQSKTYYAGSVATVLFVLVFGFIGLIYLFMYLLKKHATRDTSKWAYIGAVIAMMVYISLVSITASQMPAFGKSFTVSPLAKIILGACLYLISIVLNKISKKNAEKA